MHTRLKALKLSECANVRQAFQLVVVHRQQAQRPKAA